MSKHLPKRSHFIGLGLLSSTVLIADVARSQTELLKVAQTDNLVQSSPVSTTTSPNSNTTAISTSAHTFILPTPALIAIIVILGGLASFPLVHLLLNSKKTTQIAKDSIWSKLADRFQKPKVLESDAFLHQRSFEKLTQITNQVENLNADKFGNTEFMTFFKVKSYIARSIDEYANLDEIVELLKVAIETQGSFAKIDSTESRYCSSSQQELYNFVNELFIHDIEPQIFQEKVDLKLQEILPRLKTDEGKVALETYIQEVKKVSKHPLALKLLLLFKKYQLEDYSILRGVTNTINQLESEDLLNLDGLLLLVMVKYDIFEKLGPIIGVSEEYNRPETYSKMLQYIGLKSRHEDSYQKFREFLAILQPWEIQHKTVMNVRQKYSSKEHRLPKDFTAELPGSALFNKYKDSFHLLTPGVPKQIKQVVTPNIEMPVLTGVA